MKTTRAMQGLAAGVSAIALMSIATPASAQSEVEELRREMRQMQQRIDQLEGNVQETRDAVEATSGAPSIKPEKDVRLTIAGRVNQAFLYAEQADQDQAFVVDNDGSGSRFEFLGEADLGAWTTGTKIVVSAEVNSTDEIKFDNLSSGNADAGDFRKVNWFIEHGQFGYFSIGRGDTAAEDVTHVDLSGTSMAGAGSDVDDMAGGLEFVSEQGNQLTEVDDFFDAQDGGRASRVFYETPSLAGFSLMGSLKNNDAEDGISPAVGFNYGAEISSFEVEAAGAWRTEERGGGADDDFFTGSASVLTPFGLNVTIAGSTADLESSTADDPNMIFGKLGYKADLFAVGGSAFSVDIYRGHNADGFAAPDGDLPEATSYGVSFVQDIDTLATELFVTARQYDVDDVYIGANEQDVDEMTAVMSGARVRF